MFKSIIALVCAFVVAQSQYHHHHVGGGLGGFGIGGRPVVVGRCSAGAPIYL
jgi:hypothetical protein